MADLDSEGTIAFVKELTKHVAELNREIAKTGEQAGVGIHKGTEETEKFGKTVERHTHHLEGMNLSMGRLGGLVRGFGGAAALATGAFQAMQTHVTEGLNLRNFATDLGLSAQAVGRLRTQLAAAGVDSKTADQQIASLMAKLDDIKTLESASSVYKDLAANDPKFAAALLNAEKYGTRLEAIAIVQEKLARTNEPRSTKYTLGKLGLAPSTGAALNKDYGDRLIQPRAYSEKELEEFNVFVTNASTLSKNIWGKAMQDLVEDTNKAVSASKAGIEGLQEFYNRTFKNGGPLSDEKIMEFFNKFKGSSSFKDRFGDWEDDEIPENAKPTSLGLRESLVRDELDIDKSSNRVLQDIRAALDETRKGEGGSAGSAGASASGGNAPTSGGPPGPSGGAGTGVPTGVRNIGATPPMGANVGAQIAASSDAVDSAIRATAGKAGMGEAHWKGIAAIESSLNPASNANAGTQYKGLFQIGRSEWAGSGSGNIYNPRDNAEAAAKLAADNSAKFKERFGRDPTPAEIYLMHQQGLGFYTKGTMTNIGGNLPPTLKGRNPRSITHAEFEEGWRIEVERRAQRYAVPTGNTQDARASMDKSLAFNRDLGGAKIKVDFGDLAKQQTGVGVIDTPPFKKLKLDRAPQAPAAGGGSADFNRFAFE
jgi:hypothetical protein